MSRPRFIFNTSGKYVAYVVGNNIFTRQNRWFGWIAQGNEVYDSKGNFAGYLLNDDRIARRRTDRPKLRKIPPLPPIPPLRPIPSLPRLPMPPLPLPYEDIFLHEEDHNLKFGS